MLDDERLYQQVMAGDEAALVELVTRYHSSIYKFLYRFTGDQTLAEDLTQDTFTRLLTYQGSPPARFKSWVYTIASNLARDHLKSAPYRYEHDTDFQNDGESITGDLDVLTDERDDVIAALAKITPDHRAVLILRFYHDLKLEEIADILDIPLGTVKSRLFHALKALKGFLSVTEVVYDR